MRTDKADRHRRLCELIEQTIAEQGQEFEGQTWAVRPREEWAELAGVSLATLKRLIRQAPIRTTSTMVQGRRAVLLRVGNPAPMSVREIANAMAAAYFKAYARYPQAPDYGCLRGLAEIWPSGHQVAIFKAVLNDLPAFITAVKLIEPSPKYYKYLPIGLLRKHPELGQEVYAMVVQAKAHKIGMAPAEALTLYPN